MTKPRGEPVGVELDGQEKTTMVDAEMIKFVELLKENSLEFVQSLMDMPTLDPSVIIHRLNLDLSAKRVVQKKRVFTTKRQKAIAKEVDNLKLAGFIKEEKTTYLGYHQIPVYPKDEEKTTFITDIGTFFYKVMPFDLKNVKATYQRMVTKILKGLIEINMETYWSKASYLSNT